MRLALLHCKCISKKVVNKFITKTHFNQYYLWNKNYLAYIPLFRCITKRTLSYTAEPRRKSFMATISRGSLAFINKPRRDSKLLYTNSIPAANYTNSPTFSDLTTSANAKKTSSSIQKKIFNRKVLQDVQTNKNSRNNEFKVRIWSDIYFMNSNKRRCWTIRSKI